MALPSELAEDPPSYLRNTRKPLRIVAGGVRRQDSVSNAFQSAAPDGDVILVHDAARPFVSADLIRRTIEAAAASRRRRWPPSRRATRSSEPRHGANRRGDARRANRSISRRRRRGFAARCCAMRCARGRRRRHRRSGARRARRPSGAHRRRRGDEHQDHDAGGHGDGARRLPAATGPRGRVAPGSGYDLHRLVAGRPLVLGGVTIPSDHGALGHSDADVVCHAVTDAILGAAVAGGHRPAFSGHAIRAGRTPAAWICCGRWSGRPRRAGSRSATWM